MGISKWYVGDTAPLLTIQLIPDTGYVDVTGLNISHFSMQILDSQQNVTPGQGTFSNIIAAQGPYDAQTDHAATPASVQYHLAPNDVATAGVYTLRIKIAFGADTQTFDLGQWRVA